MSRVAIDARESGTSTGRYVDKLIEYLHKLEPEHEIIVLSKVDRIDFFKEIAPNFEIVQSDFKEFTFAEQLGFFKQVKSLKADLVHFAITQQPVFYRGKTATTIHDLTTARFRNPAKNPLVFWFKQQVYKWAIKRVANKSQALITPSEYVKYDVAQFAKIDHHKIIVTYEATDKIEEKPDPIKDLVDKKFLMYVGRPTPHKNLTRLVSAFARLHQENPKLLLALVGKNDANYERINKLVAAKDLEQAVVFTGFVSEGQLRWLYEHTLAYVFPSLSEGFGLPALEAMAHGAPVVCSHATCLPEIYGPGAHYFDPRSVHDMADKIQEVIGNSQLRAKLIKAGEGQAQKYSWQDAAQKTLEIYREVLK